MSALVYLESLHVVHRDLAARSVCLLLIFLQYYKKLVFFLTFYRNVLVGAELLKCVKIGDFGMTRALPAAAGYVVKVIVGFKK